MRPGRNNAAQIPRGHIRLESGDFGWDYIIRNHEGQTLLVQTDFEYPGFATTFGWQPCHEDTDGTVRCPTCGAPAHQLINGAQEYLDEHVGDVVPDPGYFE